MDMKKAKYMFMKYIKVKAPKEKKKKVKKDKVVSNPINVVESGNEPMDWFDNSLYENDGGGMFDDSFYDEFYTSSNNSFIDDLDEIFISEDYKVSKKEALTSIEAKTPFIVEKVDGKKPRIDEYDNVYKTVSKIKHSDGQRARRVGYMRVADKIERQPILFMREKNILGVFHGKCIITKKKGFNQSKIGYVKLESNGMEIDRYVEITKSKGIRPLMMWLLVLGLVFLLKDVKMPENWNFDWKNLRLYKTEEYTEYKESIVEINHNMQGTLTDGILKLNMTSKGNEDTDGLILYNVKILDVGSNDILYESGLLEKVDIQEIEISKNYEVGEFECKIICDTYRDSKLKFIGTVESDFILVVE